MSVLIKGMEMPKRQILAVINPNGLVEVLAGNTLIAEFEAVPVPPHGRLIDADELAEKHRELAYELLGTNYDFHMTAKAWVDNAPTIIPAEEGE